ncbi:unnamed protein product, partial [Urochloa humidicola]
EEKERSPPIRNSPKSSQTLAAAPPDFGPSSPPMATRSLATRMWPPAAASALRRQPARPRFVDTILSQNGNATRKFSSEYEASRAVLEDAKKEEKATRKFMRHLRTVKFMKWALNLGISVTAAALVVQRVSRV